MPISASGSRDLVQSTIAGPKFPGTANKESQNKVKSMPTLFLSNIQSFGKSEGKDKTIETEEVLTLNNVEVAVFSETWLTDETVDRLPFKKYQKFHLIRKNVLRCSGGVSIFVKDALPATRLKLQVPDDIECIWVTIRPNWLPRTVSNIIVCGVYYPGSDSIYSPNQEDLIFHITTSVLYLKRKYENPLFFIMGDFNDLPIDSICSLCDLKQEVKTITRDRATLDLILTNKNNNFYEAPISLPKIRGSDHFPILYIAKRYVPPKTEKKIIKIRKFPNSAKLQFGAWITNFEWRELCEMAQVNDRVGYFTDLLWKVIDIYFPLTNVVIASTDKEWVTPKIKKLISGRQKAHFEGKIELRDSLAKKIKHEINEAKIEFHHSKVGFIKDTDPKEWYRHINNIINNGNFAQLNLNNIPELSQKKPCEQKDIINEYFANICKKYPPLEIETIPNIEPDDSVIIETTEFETYKMILKFSKKSLGINDFPRKILKEFAVELATPYCNIINCSIKSGVFPDEYKKAEITPIPKVNPPMSLSDLRPISKTPIGGKMIETVLMKELNKDLTGKLDTDQYGNIKGRSTTHYLVSLTNEGYASTNRGDATTAVTIDYSKAFDYVDHSILIEKLVKLGVRPRIINLIVSFLKGRSHCTKIFDETSSYLSITCGVPQGTCSGPKLFVILINGDKCSLMSTHKFVDDKTISYSYSGDATQVLQTALDIEAEETRKDKMIINGTKCHAITFNFSQNNKLPQNLILNGNVVGNCDKIKLLGVIISNNLKWSENTQHIISKVNRKMYILNKLKKYGLNVEELIVIWMTILRPLTEYAAPVWHSGLTKGDSQLLESMQKWALGIILGVKYKDNRRLYKFNNGTLRYEEVLEKIGLVPLSKRRETLTSEFALKLVKNEKFSSMFQPRLKNIQTRSRAVFQEEKPNSKRFYMSAIPYMTRILNGIQI